MCSIYRPSWQQFALSLLIVSLVGCGSSAPKGGSPTATHSAAAGGNGATGDFASRDSSTPQAKEEGHSGAGVAVSPEVFEGQVAGEKKELATGIVFRWCPPGTFLMGSPDGSPEQVEVTLSSGFWLGETEVSQGQWEALMKSTPWRGQDFVKEGANYAASYVSHGDYMDGTKEPESASEFCRRLTTREQVAGRLPEGWSYALPTEAQWEYACRAGTKTTFSFGDDKAVANDYCWNLDNGWLGGEKFAHLVGQKKPNAWGFRDLHGNVEEWCLDWCDSTFPGGVDPVSKDGSGRVSRGGSWNASLDRCESASRGGLPPSFKNCDVGFRVAAVRK